MSRISLTLKAQQAIKGVSTQHYTYYKELLSDIASTPRVQTLFQLVPKMLPTTPAVTLPTDDRFPPLRRVRLASPRIGQVMPVSR